MHHKLNNKNKTENKERKKIVTEKWRKFSKTLSCTKSASLCCVPIGISENKRPKFGMKQGKKGKRKRR